MNLVIGRPRIRRIGKHSVLNGGFCGLVDLRNGAGIDGVPQKAPAGADMHGVAHDAGVSPIPRQRRLPLAGQHTLTHGNLKRRQALSGADTAPGLNCYVQIQPQTRRTPEMRG